MAHVLVVDDEPSARDLLATVLRYAGHEVIEARDGVEALQRATETKPDAVIADLLMPTMDGFEFVRQLREKPGFARTPVVFYTASYLESEARQLAIACGVAHIIAKPAEPEQILATMGRVLNAPHPRVAPPPETEFHREHLSVLTAKLSRRRAEIAPRLGAMIELGLQFASERDPEKLLLDFCAAARRIITAKFAAVGVLDGEGAGPRRIVCGLADAAAEKLSGGRDLFPLAEKLLSQRDPVRLAHLPGDPVLAGLSPDFPPTHSLVGAPIVSPDRHYGWLLLIDKLGEGEFSEEDEGLAQILAAQVGRIYENGSLYAHLAQHARVLEREVAERRMAAAALRESEQRFRSLVEASAEIVWRADPAGAITDVSDPSGYIGGTSRALGADWLELLHPDDRAGAAAAWRRAVETRSRYEAEYRFRLFDGSYRHFQARAVPMFEPGGALREWVGMTIDIHERVLARHALHQLNVALEQRVAERTAELEHANKELEAFSYSVSHDLRAPLRAVTGFSEILLSEHLADLPPPAQRQLRRITDAATRMGQLIDDLLNLSRVTTREMLPTTVNLSELAEGIAAELRQADRERAVEWRIAPELVAAGDLNLIRVVLDNLLRNAWKFTSKRPGARIELGALERDGAALVFFVRDNGAGFEPAYAGRLFTPFHRLHTEREFPGTGIGLAIVSRIIRRHGGRIWAEGKAGEGATFYFTLPAAPEV